MAQRKRSQNSGDALRLRVRVTIHPDGVGLLDYLQGISPAGLSMEILQLIQLGYQLRMAMGRMSFSPLGQMLPSPAPVADSAAPLDLSVSDGAPERTQVSAADHMEEGASCASPFDAKFKSLFGQAYEKTMNKRATARTGPPGE